MLAQLRDPAAAGLAAAIDGGDAEAIYTRLLGLFADGNTWVFAVEDSHWADGATLDVLRFLARRVGSLPVLLLVSYRDDEVGEQHPLAVALGDVATCAAVTRIGLARRERDVLELLSAGHRDADIATILCISPKTVSNHVSAILTKLGVQNRT